MSVNSKQDKQFAVSTAVLDIIEKEGLSGVNHSKVSRKAGVSRPWIYEYIGKDKSSLIEFAANELGAFFSRVNLTDQPKNKSELEKQLHEGTAFLLEAAQLSPTAIKLFYRYRGTANPIGHIIEKFEQKWINAATKTLSKILELPPLQATLLVEFILTVRLGYAHRLTTSTEPKESQQRATEAFAAIHNLLGSVLGG